MIFQKEMLKLYAITDRGCLTPKYPTIYDQVKAALEGGVTIVQLREKNLSYDEFLAEAISIRELCHSYNVPLIINDNLDIAIESKADGVHVGIEDTPVSEIRKKAGKDFIIGATSKTLEQAHIAYESGANYMGVGAVFPSPTKKNAIRITNEQLNSIVNSVPIPAVAIGGITYDNIKEIKCENLAGYALVSAIFGANDITKAAKDLLERIDSI